MHAHVYVRMHTCSCVNTWNGPGADSSDPTGDSQLSQLHSSSSLGPSHFCPCRGKSPPESPRHTSTASCAVGALWRRPDLGGGCKRQVAALQLFLLKPPGLDFLVSTCLSSQDVINTTVLTHTYVFPSRNNTHNLFFTLVVHTHTHTQDFDSG